MIVNRKITRKANEAISKCKNSLIECCIELCQKVNRHKEDVFNVLLKNKIVVNCELGKKEIKILDQVYVNTNYQKLNSCIFLDDGDTFIPLSLLTIEELWDVYQALLKTVRSE